MDASKSPDLVVPVWGRLRLDRLPLLTLVVSGVALLLAFFPAWSRWLIYDRPAILSGQTWRLFSGHWVHFSGQHLAYDVFGFALASWMIEARGLLRFAWLCGVAPWLISLVLLVLEPQMRFCGGLSGLATSAMVFLAVSGLRDAPYWSWICRGALLATVAKIVFECTNGCTLFAVIEGVPTVCSVTSHIIGALVGFGFGLVELRAHCLAQFSPEKK